MTLPPLLRLAGPGRLRPNATKSLLQVFASRLSKSRRFHRGFCSDKPSGELIHLWIASGSQRSPTLTERSMASGQTMLPIRWWGAPRSGNVVGALSGADQDQLLGGRACRMQARPGDQGGGKARDRRQTPQGFDSPKSGLLQRTTNGLRCMLGLLATNSARGRSSTRSNG